MTNHQQKSLSTAILITICRRTELDNAVCLQDGAAQPEPPELSPQPQPACSTPPAMSLELQTCGSGASSATNICKGSQSPPEALSQWAQAPGSGTFDLLDVEDIPRPQKPLPHLSQLPAMQQVNDWNDPLPFSLDTWYLDGATRVPPLPRHRGSEGISGTPYSPQQLQQTQLHYPIELDGNSPALSWEEIPQGLLSFPSSPTFPNAGHLQHDVTSGKDILDQSFLSDTRSDLAMLQRALGQPERAPSQGPQQSTQFDANPAGPQLLSANLPYAPALWDMPADNLAPTFAARSTAAVMPSVHMPHDFQGAGFGAECPFSNASSLEPFPECALVTDDWSSGYPHGPGVQPGPILRGRVIAPAEYRAQPSSFHSRL